MGTNAIMKCKLILDELRRDGYHKEVSTAVLRNKIMIHGGITEVTIFRYLSAMEKLGWISRDSKNVGIWRITKKSQVFV